MKVEAEITKKMVINAKYLVADMGVRYYEDAEVNGVEDDDDNPKIPCVDKYRRWIIKIDIDNGTIVNWDGKTEAVVHYKVCDDGTYSLYDDDMDLINTFEDYVPEILSQDDYGYGDYVYLTIDKDGHIKNWNVTEKMIQHLATNKGF